MATRFEDVETLLGIAPEDAGSPLALAHSIEDGLSVGAVDRLAKVVAPDDSELKFRIVPKATLSRRRKNRQKLTNEEGNRLARLAKVYSMAVMVYQDERKVRDFLMRPHMMLDNESPIDLALATGPGADAVVNLLGRAAYGGGV